MQNLHSFESIFDIFFFFLLARSLNIWFLGLGSLNCVKTLPYNERNMNLVLKTIPSEKPRHYPKQSERSSLKENQISGILSLFDP